jgi:hypothetical protein
MTSRQEDGRSRQGKPTGETGIPGIREITPERVRARRAAKTRADGLPRAYEVERELVVPLRLHDAETLLAPVIVGVKKFEGARVWTGVAVRFPTHEETASGTPPEVLGSMIYIGDRISAGRAMEIADSWVNDSTVYVAKEIL